MMKFNKPMLRKANFQQWTIPADVNTNYTYPKLNVTNP